MRLHHRVARLWRTVRHLRWVQFTGRLRVKLQRPQPDLRPAPALRPAVAAWAEPARRGPSLLGPATMRYLGEQRSLEDVGWDAPTVPLLWRYNQHYFDDLCAQGAAGRAAWHRALLTRWIAENPPGRGTAWAPYPTSLRIVNWVKWWGTSAGTCPPETAWVHSLAVQARWLTQRLEWHLLGNHLFANAKALVFAGLYFQGPEAEAWLALGQRILLRELPEQVLPDGGQFERSPMYHALALEDVLDLLNALQAYRLAQTEALQAQLAAVVPKMLDWLRCMARPDGSLVRFNDCADGIAPSVEELERYARALGFATTPRPSVDSLIRMEPSGYARLQGPGALVWLDLAPVGPDYLPGHAHADTLSFELVVDGRPVVVNRGTSVYGDGPRRQLERGTAAQSTVAVAGLDSSEVWAGFRVGRRAHVLDVSVELVDDASVRIGQSDYGGPPTVRISACHDGYAHLPGQPQHRRQWTWVSGGPTHSAGSPDSNQRDPVDPNGSLTVSDELLAAPAFAGWAAGRAPSVARFHLAPGLTLAPRGAHVWLVKEGLALIATVRVEEGQAGVETWQHAAGFGDLREACTLAVTMDTHTWRSRVVWHWGGTVPPDPVLDD